MPKHRMVVGKIDFSRDADALRLGLGAVIEDDAFTAVELPEKVEMPPRAPKLTVGGELEADVFLLADALFDFFVLDRHEPMVGDRILGPLGTRLLEGVGAQQAADHIGAEGRMAVGHGRYSFFRLPPSIIAACDCC